MERSDARKRRTEAADLFWRDLNADMQDPEYARLHAEAARNIALDDAIRRIVRDAMADAWDQGWQTAIAQPYDTPNPYRETPQ